MSLDEFFAKQKQKKTKKKKNQFDLIDQLVKENENPKDTAETVAPNNSILKPTNIENEDEWELIDDEKEVDIQNIRISTLSTVGSEDTSKQLPKSKEGQDEEDATDEKKVWATKITTQPVEVLPEPVVEAPTEPRPYVPVHLRKSITQAVKPNVSSATDFPTLDAAAVTEVPKKIPVENDPSWQLAGVKRPNRETSASVGVIPTSVPAYVPPSLRRGANGISSTPTTNYGYRASFGNEVTPRRDSDYFRQRDYEPPSNPSNIDSTEGWTRGHKVLPDPSNNMLTIQIPSQRSNVSKPTSDDGWSRNVHIKSYKETAREKTPLVFVSTNRFAGLSET